MPRLFSALLLLVASFPAGLCVAAEFNIGEYRALSLLGEARLLPDTDYVSFAGDFGFSRRLPPTEAIRQHLAFESKLLANFHLSVINLEFMLPGFTGQQIDRQIDELVVDALQRAGYDVISRANNHALDYGPEGVRYNKAKLGAAGFQMIGTRDYPVYDWQAGAYRIAIYAVTDYADREDSEGLVLKVNSPDLSLIKEKSFDADFRVAFIHLGSVSVFPSPHEREQVKRLISAGADLVVCTGSHFTKGFVMENGKPVVYGLGNHLFSYIGPDTEPIGMHLVAGFKAGELAQLFVIPFQNAVMKGRTGPPDEATFATFRKTFLERSTTDTSSYFSDSRSLRKLKERLLRLSNSGLGDLKPRHVVYAIGIVLYHYSIVVIAGSALVLLSVVLFLRRRVLSRRSKNRDEATPTAL
ncbi:MAG: CapA family protein [Candidatus Binatia bacterium]